MTTVIKLVDEIRNLMRVKETRRAWYRFLNFWGAEMRHRQGHMNCKTYVRRHDL